MKRALFLVLVAACSRAETAPDGGASPLSAPVDAHVEPAAAAPSYDPCAILPASALARVLPETAGQAFVVHEGVRTAPALDAYLEERERRGLGASCVRSFPKRDAKAIAARADAQRRAMVLERVEARRKNAADAGSMPRLSESFAEIEQPRARVVLTMTTKAPYATREDARAAFDAATRGGGDVDAGAGDGPAPGLGDAAAFRRGYLHVLSGRHVFRIEVAAAPGRDAQIASDLARIALDNLPGD